jgi:hypothetical protein
VDVGHATACSTKNDELRPGQDLPGKPGFEADFNSRYFVRMFAHDTNVGDEDGDGIEAVIFTVRDEDGNLVYERPNRPPVTVFEAASQNATLGI